MNSANQFAGMIAGAFVVLLLTLLLLLALVVAVRLFRSKAAKARRSANELTCSRCGYDLSRIRVPRCPECGALAGFGRSAEELNINGEIQWKHERQSR